MQNPAVLKSAKPDIQAQGTATRHDILLILDPYTRVHTLEEGFRHCISTYINTHDILRQKDPCQT